MRLLLLHCMVIISNVFIASRGGGCEARNAVSSYKHGKRELQFAAYPQATLNGNSFQRDFYNFYQQQQQQEQQQNTIEDPGYNKQDENQLAMFTKAFNDNPLEQFGKIANSTNIHNFLEFNNPPGQMFHLIYVPLNINKATQTQSADNQVSKQTPAKIAQNLAYTGPQMFPNNNAPMAQTTNTNTNNQAQPQSQPPTQTQPQPQQQPLMQTQQQPQMQQQMQLQMLPQQQPLIQPQPQALMQTQMQPQMQPQMQLQQQSQMQLQQQPQIQPQQQTQLQSQQQTLQQPQLNALTTAQFFNSDNNRPQSNSLPANYQFTYNPVNQGFMPSPYPVVPLYPTRSTATPTTAPSQSNNIASKMPTRMEAPFIPSQFLGYTPSAGTTTLRPTYMDYNSNLMKSTQNTAATHQAMISAVGNSQNPQMPGNMGYMPAHNYYGVVRNMQRY